MKTHRRNKRRQDGNILVISIALLCLIVAIGATYGVNLTRMMGAHQEQVSAIEGASLAAAKDLQRIVIDDPNLGLISLSNYPPIGKATKAGDNYFMPVLSINSLLATVRLEAILADKFDDITLKKFAERDYAMVIAAKNRLNTALADAIKKDGFGYDIDGNKIEPLKDAEAAYLSANQRMAAGTNSLVPNSLTLELGVIDNLVTTTNIPNPNSFAYCTADMQQGGYYRSNINVPYNDYDFVFASVSDTTSLVDAKKFKLVEASLPYAIPCVVRCQADQRYDLPNPGQDTGPGTVHVVSCAQPASLNDHRPSPGVLSISFPSGSVPEVRTLYDLLMDSKLTQSPADLSQTAWTEDYPPANLTEITMPIVNDSHGPAGQLMRIAFFDWVRRAGPGLNIQSLTDALKVSLTESALPHSDLFKFNGNGTISTSSRPLDPTLSLPVSNKQSYEISGLALHSTNGVNYDLYIRDFCFQPGRINGGLHGGEPLGEAAAEPPPPPNPGDPPLAIDEYPTMLSAFPTGPDAGAVRPTYEKAGIAVDFRLEKR